MRFMRLPAFPFFIAVLMGCASQSGPAPAPVSSTEGTTLVQTGYVTDVRNTLYAVGKIQRQGRWSAL